MNDAKNLFLAWISASSPVVAAVSSDTGLTILSAVILPVIFFAIGKTIDVLLQLKGRNTSCSECDPDSPVSAQTCRNANLNGRAPGNAGERMEEKL